MHHQRSLKAQRSLKFGACHLLFNILLAAGAVGVLAYGVYRYEQEWVYAGVGLVLLWVVSTVFFFLRGAFLKCPLCMNPVWGSRKCQKHPKVKPALGVSYRLGIACSVAFKGRYRCPYCGEPFSAQFGVRSSRRSRQQNMV